MKINKDKLNPPDPDSIMNDFGTISATECTGLIRIPPFNEEERRAYEDLYQLSPKVAKQMHDIENKNK